MKKISLFVPALLFIILASASADATTLSLSAVSYIERCLAESSALTAQEEMVATVELTLEELRISDTPEIDLVAAELNVRVERAKTAELESSIVTDALGDFVALLMARRELTHAETALAISAEKEAAAKNQTEEGVKNELDYFSEYLAYRNALIAGMSAEFAHDNALRRFRRRLILLESAPTQLLDSPVRLPKNFSASQEEVLEKAKAASSAYLRAAGNLSIQTRRYAVFRELESAAKTLTSMRIAEQAAIRALTAQEHALEDRSSSMIQHFRILEATAAVGLEQLKVAELRWEEKKRGFTFGVVTDRQLREYDLAYEREIDAQKRKEYELLIHYLKLTAFMGEDPQVEANRLLP